jgi:hypothetical protein
MEPLRMIDCVVELLRVGFEPWAMVDVFAAELVAELTILCGEEDVFMPDGIGALRWNDQLLPPQ